MGNENHYIFTGTRNKICILVYPLVHESRNYQKRAKLFSLNKKKFKHIRNHKQFEFSHSTRKLYTSNSKKRVDLLEIFNTDEYFIVSLNNILIIGIQKK